MKTHLLRLAGIFLGALLLLSMSSAFGASKKESKSKTPASPTDQLEAARTATKKLPALAVEATIKREKFEIHLKVRRVGDDWELVMSGKQPMTLVRKDGKYFISDDGGRNWRPTDADDTLITAVMAPLENGQVVGSPRRVTYESVGKENVNGVDLVHLRMVPDKGDKVDVNDLPEDWLVAEGKNSWLLRRSHSYAILFKQMVNADITYTALPKDTVIDAPVPK